ncbi:MAG: bifunctional phosphopantothenoylcysteine decarboxylase/phosphopantothenate--cysteine ligase CoaBC, partial [Gammaproteobacteria bacterium]|nr:bifunctional phosphopantothenoylcysteine decarboxylase/phosphopantothenate--cysteine ligase CoaBC [Gammaproteobacteria bacterium]
MRRNRRILVGVTGGIAAYKSPDLVRRLIDRGGDVRVVMTEAACEFITPLTLQAVSGHPVHQCLLDAEAESGMGHIELARWAEIIVIAPATANFIAGMVSGKADDLLTTLILASEADIAVAPAMNRQMWQNPVTQDNLEVLKQRGVRIIGPAEGGQACGEVGPGRMSEPDEIAQELLGDGMPKLLAGVRITLTAGPTWEAIDPVRGITNRSSGKMGFALAEAARDFGAEVTLISGPVALETPSGVERIDVVSAQDMFDKVQGHIGNADMFIGVAAVSDYRPVLRAENKIKKDTESMELKLIRTPDILRSVAELENPPFTVGFAADTERI